MSLKEIKRSQQEFTRKSTGIKRSLKRNYIIGSKPKETFIHEKSETFSLQAFFIANSLFARLKI